MSYPVGLVHDWLTGQRGGENVLEAIARLVPGAPIYTLFHFPGSVSPEIEAHPIVTSFLDRAPGIDPWYRWYLPLYPFAIEDLPVAGHRLVVSSSHCVAKGARRGPGALHVCYCHTPVRYAWDQLESYFGGGGALRLAQRLVLSALRRWDVATAGRVDHYLANSRFVAGRIERYYGRTAEVLAPPVDTGFFTPGPPAERSHVLMVAALAPYKSVDRAIHACERAGLPLVVVGEGPERPRLERLAGSRTRLVGRVDAERLRELYRGAICFLQTGIEDFGIAAAEALACGTPVVARGEGGVLDIVEDGRHGVLYAGDEPAGVAAAIDKCRGMEFNSMNLRERAEEFSAGRFAQGLRETLVSRWPDAEGILV
ncbi:MAG: putative glycosyl transferase [Acidobacteriota bacterium]